MAVKADYPSWAKDFQQELASTITNSLKNVIDKLSTKIDGRVESNNFMEHSLQTALNDGQLAKDSTMKLEAHVSAQGEVIKSQAKQIEEAEAYSKRYNLKYFNIVESSNENSYILLDKLAFVFRTWILTSKGSSLIMYIGCQIVARVQAQL